MNWRIRNFRFLIKIGAFIQSLPVVVLKPRELIECSRQTYNPHGKSDPWAEDQLVDSGLSVEEEALIKSVPASEGNILLLGLGGGRKAIAFAKMGDKVTGVDFIPSLVEKAINNAANRGYALTGLKQEFSEFSVQEDHFDLVWISRDMYSCIPSRDRRVQMGRRINKSIKPGGYFFCQFFIDPYRHPSHRGVALRHAIAESTFGNKHLEPGDF